jgi:cell division transport system permease protein
MKRKLITFGRIIKAGVQNFVRNATLAVAAIAVMVITLTIVLLSIIANATFTNTIDGLTDRIDISVYLKDSVKSDRKDQLIAELEALDNVQGVEYKSKEQVLEEQQDPAEGNIDIQRALAQIENPFPATIHINPVDANHLESIQAYLEQPQIVALQAAKTSYSGERREAVEKITNAAEFLRQAGLVGVIVFATVSMLIIFNTIRMAIFNRREEIYIMRLLGASTWYIRGPFVVETILYGMVSAVVSMSILNSLFVVSASAFQASSLGLLDITYSNTYFAENFWIILASQLGLGILIGTVSSVIATRRYLKFKTSK